jgi:hypothetical protein
MNSYQGQLTCDHCILILLVVFSLLVSTNSGIITQNVSRHNYINNEYIYLFTFTYYRNPNYNFENV